MATTGAVSVSLGDEFATSIGAEYDDFKVEEAAFDADGNIYVALSGSYGYNPFEDVDSIEGTGINAIEYENKTKDFIIDKFGSGYVTILQGLGDELLTETESDKVKDFYEGLDTPSQANFYAGLMVLAKETNPTFEQKVKESFNTNVRGITYDELISALQ